MTQWNVTLWLACYVAVFAGLSIFGAHRLRILWLYWRHRRQDAAAARAGFESLPMVTVQLPLFNELHVVDRLLDAVGELDYPKDSLQIQILDDSTDETREACERGRGRTAGARIRRGIPPPHPDRTGFKAGALEEATADREGRVPAHFRRGFRAAAGPAARR